MLELTASLSVAACLAGAALLTLGCTSASGADRRVPLPDASTLTAAPLRNEVTVALDAPIEEVWALVSDHIQFPSYSSGLREVDVENHDGGPAGGVGCARTCHFTEGPSLTEVVVFVQEPHAYATRAVEPNAYELTNDLSWITLRSIDDGGTEFAWQQYYDHPDLAQISQVFDEALQDIGRQLAERFGGRFLP